MVFTLSWVGLGSAQDMRDHWVVGKGAHIEFEDTGPVYRGKIPGKFNEGVSSVSDSMGNLRLYGHPGTVYHSGFDTVVNGNLEWSCYPNDIGSTITQGSLLLPSSDSVVQYVNIRGATEDCFNQYLYFNRIIARSDSASASVVNGFDPPKYNLPVSERLAAVKHGNGIDWWVVNTNALGPERIKSDHLLVWYVAQDSVYLWDSIRITPINKVSEMTFSSNGNRLVIANAIATSDTQSISYILCNFDRCDGVISNERVVDYNRGTYGAAFSPTGNLLYLSIWGEPGDCGIVQVDLRDSSMPYQIIYDCENDEDRFVAQLELGPNGIIYFSITSINPLDSAIWFLHSIETPEVVGAGCNVSPMNVRLENSAVHWFGFTGLPNHPNYYLGPDPRCSGDTTTTDTTSAIAPVPEAPTWKVYPTVSEGTVTVETSSPGGDITVLDAMGRIVLRSGLRAGRARWSTTAWPAGMYRVLLHRDGRYLGARTVVRP